jgi:DegV family protein with EDD domain
MTGRVAIVTDSTAYLCAEAIARHGIRVVPLRVVTAREQHDEGDPKADVAALLRSGEVVTTSRPAPQALLSTYDELARDGATAVVSVHISAGISGTVDSARLAARGAAVPVHVVDSRSLGMGLGYAVTSAALAAEAGDGAEEVAAIAEKRATGASILFYVDTLEYLRRGGRIGAASALLGSALSVKPLLHLVDGRIAPLDRVRTSARALARLEELAVEQAAGQRVDLAVHHLAAAGRAEELAERLRARLPDAGEVYVGQVGAVVGAHVGPGMLAVVVSPR